MTAKDAAALTMRTRRTRLIPIFNSPCGATGLAGPTGPQGPTGPAGSNLTKVVQAQFSVTGSNFLTAGNVFEVTRLAVELGLLALALTPVIITGGIDLSVGSMMGLSAVVLGSLWRDAHWPMPVAIGAALILGALGGGLNALMIARLNLPPLIVTLGTFSLFRGIAEGLTRGIDNYSGFTSSFLFLGQGYIGGLIPAQLFVLLVAIAGWTWWLHRASDGGGLWFRTESRWAGDWDLSTCYLGFHRV